MILAMKIDDSSREAVLARLKPHLPTLDLCFRAAWERWTEWLKRLDGAPSDVTPRSRASVLYDFIVAEAVKSFLGTKDIKVRKEHGFLVLRFQDRVALRFKKFRNRNLNVSANKTGQTELFNSQTLEFPPGSLKPMTHVVAGYLLDSLAMDITRLAITCTCDGVPLWAPIDILPAPAPSVKRLGGTQPAPKATVRSAWERPEGETGSS
jgi:hypothetical protein